MGYSLFLMVVLVALVLGAFAFMKASPAAIAKTIRMTGPVLVCLAGLAFVLTGRVGLGLPLLVTGGIWYARSRDAGSIPSTSGGTTSTVRSAWLEMQLDHDTGEMDGAVLTGPMEGQLLSMMNDGGLLSLYQQLQDDPDSAALMEAYLDRRIAGWRENANTGAADGERQPPGTGPMSKEEAYQILGLAPGAGVAEITAAHRRLMKVVHPDSGGSTFLAARINEAKDTLLE